MRYALDSIYWGHSLIELGDLSLTATAASVIRM